MSTNANGQTTISKTIDLSDTTAAAKQDVDAAESLLKKFGSVAAYGADIKADLDSTFTVEIWELQNVKSRVESGESTQYVVKFMNSGKEEVVITPENPTTKLTVATNGSSGCYCFSVTQGDDDGNIDPGLLE